MKILSEHLAIILDKSPKDPNFYDIQVYPNVVNLPKADDEKYRLDLSLKSVKTDVKLRPLILSTIVNTSISESDLITEFLNGSSEIPLFSFMDSPIELRVCYDDCIARMSFSYTDIMDIGFIERQLIYFDVNFNTRLMGSTLILAEALHYIRNVLKWPEYLDELVV